MHVAGPEPCRGLRMHVFQRGPQQDGLVHLRFGQVVTQPETMGKPPRLAGMPRNMPFEGPDIPLPKDAVEPSMKTGIALFYVALVHRCPDDEV